MISILGDSSQDVQPANLSLSAHFSLYPRTMDECIHLFEAEPGIQTTCHTSADR